MAWDLKGGNGRIFAEINITPLTDVMLVLLVIFMVTTPLIMVESFKLKLPRAVTSTTETGKGVTISVSETGEIYVNGARVTLGMLRGALSGKFAMGTEKTVVLRADAATRHSTVVEVLDIARLAGAERLSIATEPGNRAR